MIFNLLYLFLFVGVLIVLPVLFVSLVIILLEFVFDWFRCKRDPES